MKLKTLLFTLLLGCAPLLQASELVTTAYVTLRPALTGNFVSEGVRLNVYRAEISLRVTSNNVERVEYHEALIRDQLVSLFAQQTEESFTTTEGKEQLRRRALQLVQTALEREEGEILVSDLLYNNLVIR